MSTIPPHPSCPVRELTDTGLWDLLASLGDASRISQQRFLALLPEVARRRLHRKKSFPSLLACAQQLAGVSQRKFEDVLALHRRLTATRALRSLWRLVESGEVGWSVVARVPQRLLEADPRAWLRNFRQLSKREIEELVRAARPAAPSTPTTPETRPLPGAHHVSEPATSHPSNPRPEPISTLPITPGRDATEPSEAPPEPRHPPLRCTLHLSPDEQSRLQLLLRDHQRRTGEATSLSELVTRLVQETWLHDSPGTSESATTLPKTDGTAEPTPAAALRAPPLPTPPTHDEYRQALDSAARSQGQDPPPLVARYVRKRARDLCERAGCDRPGAHLHHLFGRATKTPHHPDKLAWVCDTCHGLIHQGRVENPHDPPRLWRLRSPTDAPRSKHRDHRYQAHRRAHRDGRSTDRTTDRSTDRTHDRTHDHPRPRRAGAG